MTWRGATLIREAHIQYRDPPGHLARRRILGPPDVHRFVRELVNGDAREHFVTLLLDGRHRIIGYAVTGIGTATGALVHPREVFQVAVHAGAVAIIVTHTHPSGDPTPSREDREITARLARAGELLGIAVLDSMVVGQGPYSIREQEPKLLDGRAAP